MEQDVKRLQFTDSVPVLLLPSHNKNLILPNVNIAEFVNTVAAEPIAVAPDWFVGIISWRGQSVPLISFERLNGDLEQAPQSTTHLAIMNGIAGREELPFYAVMCSGIPRQSRIVEEDLVADDNAETGHVELSRVLLSGEPSVIPDLEVIEAQICRVLLR
ncbi:MAG: chemosensory pili system protein ChpC [Bacteroidia bacterium]|jgi:chemosensory pili system protein ChpC